MTNFAKLFEHPKYGQILVVARPGDDGVPSIVWLIKPPGLGVCEMTIEFDGDDALEKMERALTIADETMASEVYEAVWRRVAGLAA